MILKLKRVRPEEVDTGKLMFSNMDLRKLIVPLILEQFLTVLVGMVDTIMVASVGEAAVSGVSLVDEIMVLMVNVFAALGTGGAVVIGHSIGAGENRIANKSAEQAVLSVTAIAIMITALLYVGQTGIINLLFGRVEADVASGAHIYYSVVAASIPFIALYNTGAAIFRIMGNSAVSMKTSVFMNLVNVCGNAILIYGLGMGVTGAAIPTLVSRIAAAFVIMALLFRKTYAVHLSFPMDFRPDWTLIRRIMRVGVPNSLENGMFSMGRVATYSIISGLGTSQIAANAVATKIVLFQIMAGMGVGIAMITVVSQTLGAKQFVQAKYYSVKLVKLAYLLIAIMVALTIITINPVLSGFHLSKETADIARLLVIYHGVAMITVWPLSFSVPNTLRAAGDVRFPMVISTISMWVFRIGLGLVFATRGGLGAFGVWIAMSIDWTFRSLCFVPRYLRGKWLSMRV